MTRVRTSTWSSTRQRPDGRARRDGHHPQYWITDTEMRPRSGAMSMLLAVADLWSSGSARTGAVATALIFAIGLGYALGASRRRQECMGGRGERLQLVVTPWSWNLMCHRPCVGWEHIIFNLRRIRQKLFQRGRLQ